MIRHAVRLPLLPAGAHALTGKGWAHEFAEQFEEAKCCYREAALAGDVSARTLLGMLLIGEGDFERGWKLLAERPTPTVANMPPLWRGQSLRGRSIAVVGMEAGLGDELQFVRFVPWLKHLGARRVILMVPEPLRRLFSTVEGADSVVSVGTPDAAANGHRHFHPVVNEARPDLHTFSVSLPHRLAVRVHSIPNAPYLHADPGDIERWRPRLPPVGLRVGIVWRGSPGNGHDGWRSLPSLSTLAPLWEVPGVSFVSLQKGAGEDEARACPLPLTHLGSEVRDFADTAAILSQLDLLIAVDTSIVHLAGALGKPAWLLLEKVPDWRWRHPKAFERWYPSARQFRQQAPGDWSRPVQAVAGALTSLIQTPGRGITL